MTRVRAARRVVTATGLFAIWMATATACIFEKGNYQGGGRQDQGASGNTASASATTAPTVPTATSTSTTTSTPDGAPPSLDAALAD